MAKILIAFFSRADENYFSGAMRYVKVGNTEIRKELTGGNTYGKDIDRILFKS